MFGVGCAVVLRTRRPARRHGERAGAEHEVLEGHGGFACQAVGDAVQGLHVLHLVLHADLQMILQVLPNARQLVLDLDPVLLEQRSRPDSRKLE